MPTILKDKATQLGSVKWRTTANAIRTMARRSGPDAKLPTMTDLRAQFNVSLGTLNMALEDLERDNVIVRRHGSGIYAATNAKQRTIAVVCDPLFFGGEGASPFWGFLLRQLADRAETHNERLDVHMMSIVGSRYELPQSLITAITSGRVSGVLFVGHYLDGVRWIESEGVPLVSYAGSASHMVGADWSSFYRLGTRALADRGCKRVALIIPDREDSRPTELIETSPAIIALRTQFSSALALAGLDYQPSSIRFGQIKQATGLSMPLFDDAARGVQAADEWLSQPVDSRPDGLLVERDMITPSMLRRLQSAGIRIGEDVQIASHINAGAGVLDEWRSHIALISFDSAKLVNAMVNQLERLMAGDSEVERTLDVEYTHAILVADASQSCPSKYRQNRTTLH